MAQQLCKFSLKCVSATVGTVLLCAVLWGHSVIFLTTKIHFFLCGSKTTLTVECVLNKSLPSSARQPGTVAMSSFEQSLVLRRTHKGEDKNLHSLHMTYSVSSHVHTYVHTQIQININQTHQRVRPGNRSISGGNVVRAR